MDKVKISHNKKRNTALLYEFLARHITKCLVFGEKEKAKQALEISKKYFKKGQPLYEELRLFRDVLDTRVKSQTSAYKVLNSVYDSSSKLNVRNLDKCKSQIIKDINYKLGSDVYEHKIPNYVVYASLQTLLNEQRNKYKSLDEVKKVHLEDVIYEHLTQPAKEENKPVAKSEYDNVLYKLVYEKFYKKYNKILTEQQQGLIKEYIKFLLTNNDKQFQACLLKEAEEVKKQLLYIEDASIRSNKDMMKKIQECYTKLNSVDFSEIDENKVLNLLEYMQLVDEVNSSDDKE